MFPTSFQWGVGTSAFQIEGGRQDGKGDSIWDRFSDAGKLADPGDVACDHYHRWRDDVDLMRDLGINSYRFSIAWSRVIPDGVGRVNPHGMEFYRQLVTALREAGIEPVATLYHWDLPAGLQDSGGWTARSTAQAFADYARIMAEALGDHVTRWITHNEPWVASVLGYAEGFFAPGITGWDNGLSAAHHILLSHGMATRQLREILPEAEVGIALDCRPAAAGSPSPEDASATRHFDGFRNRWFFDPVFGMGYPADIVDDYVARGHLADREMPFVEPGDLTVIAEPIDFLGINYYTAVEVSAPEDESEYSGIPPGPNPPEGYTEMGWLVTPEALTAFLDRVNREYGPRSIVITENGASYSDGPDARGVINDDRRIRYLEHHIAAVADAIRSGVPVDGYYVWSLLDNLEWVSGFSQRFGLVWVDHDTGRRIPKQSYHWYRTFIAEQSAGVDSSL
jgi:beta-glucosidase